MWRSIIYTLNKKIVLDTARSFCQISTHSRKPSKSNHPSKSRASADMCGIPWRRRGGGIGVDGMGLSLHAEGKNRKASAESQTKGSVPDSTLRHMGGDIRDRAHVNVKSKGSVPVFVK
jgi:hypothetical protein